MTLSALIRKSRNVEVATATVATVATHATGKTPTVASVATVAVANPTEQKTEHTSRRWLIHFTDREPVCASCYPEASHDEILVRHPGAIAAEPFAQISKLAAPMSGEEEANIRAWLAKIGETDAANIADVLNLCQGDSAAREYFIGQAEAFEERAAVMEFDGGLSRAEAERRAYYG